MIRQEALDKAAEALAKADAANSYNVVLSNLEIARGYRELAEELSWKEEDEIFCKVVEVQNGRFYEIRYGTSLLTTLNREEAIACNIPLPVSATNVAEGES